MGKVKFATVGVELEGELWKCRGCIWWPPTLPRSRVAQDKWICGRQILKLDVRWELNMIPTHERTEHY